MTTDTLIAPEPVVVESVETVEAEDEIQMSAALADVATETTDTEPEVILAQVKAEDTPTADLLQDESVQ